MMLTRLWSHLVGDVPLVVLVAIGAWTYGRGIEDWRYQFAGSNLFLDPFERPSPWLGVLVGIIVSACLAAVALLIRAVGRRVRA